MPTRVFLTIDTELLWRHHSAGLDAEAIVARSLEPAGVGIAWQLEQLRRQGLKASFFVDPMPALTYGMEWMKRVVGAILDAGQEVQLHLHPNWAGAKPGDGGKVTAAFELTSYTLAEQIELLAGASDMLVRGRRARAGGVPRGQLCRERRHAHPRSPTSASATTPATTAPSTPGRARSRCRRARSRRSFIAGSPKCRCR
ncbi:MAG: hypothetical protein WDN44_13880 [Sphingomonas sp.]